MKIQDIPQMVDLIEKFDERVREAFYTRQMLSVGEATLFFGMNGGFNGFKISDVHIPFPYLSFKVHIKVGEFVRITIRETEELNSTWTLGKVGCTYIPAIRENETHIQAKRK